jgi:hypothetical protein
MEYNSHQHHRRSIRLKGYDYSQEVVLPNHIHGIIVISYVAVQHVEPLQNEYQHIIPKSIGSIIRSYKSSVTRICRQQGYLIIYS